MATRKSTKNRETAEEALIRRLAAAGISRAQFDKDLAEEERSINAGMRRMRAWMRKVGD